MSRRQYAVAKKGASQFMTPTNKPNFWSYKWADLGVLLLAREICKLAVQPPRRLASRPVSPARPGDTLPYFFATNTTTAT